MLPAKIRPATFRDLHFVCQLGEKEFARYNGPCAMTELKALEETSEADLLICAHEEFNARFGFVLVQWRPDSSYLASIAIDDRCRRQGLAEMLLNEVIVRARKRGPHDLVAHVSAKNEVALAFFKQAGFRIQNMSIQKYKNGDVALRAILSIEADS